MFNENEIFEAFEQMRISYEVWDKKFKEYMKNIKDGTITNFNIQIFDQSFKDYDEASKKYIAMTSVNNDEVKQHY